MDNAGAGWGEGVGGEGGGGACTVDETLVGGIGRINRKKCGGSVRPRDIDVVVTSQPQSSYVRSANDAQKQLERTTRRAKKIRGREIRHNQGGAREHRDTNKKAVAVSGVACIRQSCRGIQTTKKAPARLAKKKVGTRKKQSREANEESSTNKPNGRRKKDGAGGGNQRRTKKDLCRKGTGVVRRVLAQKNRRGRKRVRLSGAHP